MDSLTPNFLSFICLISTTAFCVQAHFGSKESVFGALAYILLTVYGILGAWQSFDKSTMPSSFLNTQKNLEIFLDSFVISYSSAELWARRGIAEGFIKIHLIIPLIPIFFYIFDKEFKKLNDCLVFASVLSFTFVSLMNDCTYGIISAIIFATNIYYVKKRSDFELIPPSDLSNYVYSIFSLFLLHTFHHRE
ncbi:hypothetical protein WA026_003161 [Henosepilachna vigintioctopunctata]|uniref:Uncharacterized protein n=1 Tax=Henosepilachna vigintioctopunctata TaxID=420089 RepID=A0AAW1TMK6_9CUCU